MCFSTIWVLTTGYGCNLKLFENTIQTYHSFVFSKLLVELELGGQYV